MNTKKISRLLLAAGIIMLGAGMIDSFFFSFLIGTWTDGTLEGHRDYSPIIQGVLKFIGILFLLFLLKKQERVGLIITLVISLLCLLSIGTYIQYPVRDLFSSITTPQPFPLFQNTFFVGQLFDTVCITIIGGICALVVTLCVKALHKRV